MRGIVDLHCDTVWRMDEARGKRKKISLRKSDLQVDEEKLLAIRNGGADRISINPQSLNDLQTEQQAREFLKTLGIALEETPNLVKI